VASLLQTQDRCAGCNRWFCHRVLLVPALLLVAVVADVRLTKSDVEANARRTQGRIRSVTDPAAALPRPAPTSALVPPPSTTEAQLAEHDGTRSVATVGPKPVPELRRSAPATAGAPSAETPTPLKTNIASNPAADLPRPGPTPVPGLGPAPPSREAQFIERDGTLYVGNVAPAPPAPAAAAAPVAAPAAPGRHVARAAASSYQPLIREIAARHAVPAKLVESVIHVESGFDPRAVSRRGARGLMQLMPATAEQLGVRDVFDARQNIEGGVRHLRWLLDQYGDFRLALAAYNAGEKAVESHGGVPPFSETRAYVEQVLRLYGNSEPRRPAPRATAVAAPGRGSLVRYEAPDGTVVYTNLPAPSLPPSTRDLLAGKRDADGDEVPRWATSSRSDPAAAEGDCEVVSERRACDERS
jgi:soluble lytic murein transglycosylase-like protein